MTVAEKAEVVMREHLGMVPPWDRPWKLRAFEIVLADMPKIAAFMEIGPSLVRDPVRRELSKKYLGEQNDTPHEHFGFNAWLLDKCIGERLMSNDEIFMRCLACQKVRTSAGMAEGPCKCGSRRMTTCVGDMGTRRAMWSLASGY